MWIRNRSVVLLLVILCLLPSEFVAQEGSPEELDPEGIVSEEHEATAEVTTKLAEPEDSNNSTEYSQRYPGNRNYPEVCIYQGCLVGRRMTSDSRLRPYDAFYGIPYAAPPVGSLRFKKPRPPARFDGLWDSTYHRQQCVQTSLKRADLVIGSEDCLYLNVYKPHTSSKRLPVLVFLHGGSYKFGGTDPDTYGPEFLMTKKMIVVTIQYRLGVFGFLASGDSNCKGNFGLKDQSMALRWVQDNIHAFNGDPDRVTLMGQDTGAASVHFHMMNSDSNEYFKKAILMSGYANAYWSLRDRPEKLFNDYATVAGISAVDRSDTAQVMRILKAKSALEIQQYVNQLPLPHKVYKWFRPVIEGSWRDAFMNKNPRAVWKSGAYKQRPFFVIGVGYEQGYFADLYYDLNYRNKFLSDFDASAMAVGDLTSGALLPIKQHYFDNNPTSSNIENILKFGAEWSFLYPVYQTVKQYTQYGNIKKRPVDRLLFNVSSTSFSLSTEIHPYTHLEKGPSHYDILLYLFTFRKYAEEFLRDPAEEEARVLLVNLIYQYVKNGLPDDMYPECTAAKMTPFCDYLLMDRRISDTRITYTTSNAFDDMTALEAADKIMDEYLFGVH